MSEYQYLAFRAIDRPLTGKELEYARTQSTRAEITQWSFENEYHFGDFRGDPEKLLARGYDVHLHYANFGTRTVMMRLPAGLPFPKSVWSKYVDGERLIWKKDKRGPAGILALSPFHDGGSIDEIWEPNEYVDDVVSVRNDLVRGDGRALYALWLCGSNDDYQDPAELVEPPVPGGLGQASTSLHDLLGFFGLDPLTLDAAAENSDAMPTQSEQDGQLDGWLANLSEEEARALLRQFAMGNPADAKADVLKRLRDESVSSSWPTSKGVRTVAQLFERAEELRAAKVAKEEAAQAAAAKREAKRKERERQKRMQEMVKEPKRWIKEADKLVDARGTVNYKAAAELLADLREAVGGEEGDRITLTHAAHLAKSHPTLTHLKSSLRKRGLLP